MGHYILWYKTKDIDDRLFLSVQMVLNRPLVRTVDGGLIPHDPPNVWTPVKQYKTKLLKKAKWEDLDTDTRTEFRYIKASCSVSQRNGMAPWRFKVTVGT